MRGFEEGNGHGHGAARVREQLERILASPGFQGANRRSRLLRYLVEQALEDPAASLKESVIATEVFDRAPDYDPQVDSVVRVEVGRLRSRLVEYYGQAGADEPVRIEIPKGAYRPVFAFSGGITEPAPVPPPGPRRVWRWKMLAAGAAAIAVLAGVVWLMRRATPANTASLAVLPFLNLSGDPANEYLGDGICEELTEALAQSPDLRVVARTSAFQYKGKSADVREIGRKLTAGAVIEGSVGRRGEALHVVAQLIRTSDGYHLWSEAYDTSAAELPWVEAQIGRAVHDKLSPSASAARDAVAASDPEAHDLYLRAAYEFSRRSVDSTRRAIDLASQAGRKDASYAPPYVLMAAAESQLSQLYAEAPRAASERAREDIAEALKRDPQNNGAHAQQAMLAYTDQWDWPQAEREFRITLSAGSHGSAENLYGWCLLTRGRFAEARRHLEIAAELDPLSLGPQLNQVEEMLAERRYLEARAKVEQILQVAPTNFAALALASAISFWQRDCTAASTWTGKLLQLYPQSPYSHLSALGADGVCGRLDRVPARLSEILAGHPPGYLSPYSLAAVYAAKGDADRAAAYLGKSAELREPVLLMLTVDRVFDGVREDRRVVELEHRIGLTN